jgi:hypothetical protein
MSETKLQHYVPKLILKQFADSRDQLYVFDKNNNNIFPDTIKKAGGQKYYYNFEIADEKLTLENYLCKIENKVAPYIKKIIKEKNVSILQDKERIELSIFLSIQMVRVPSFSNRANDLSQQIKNIAIKQGAPESYFEENKIMSEDKNIESIFRANQIMTAHEQAKYFIEKDWFLIETDIENPFFIGDNPVCLHNDEKYGVYGNIGLAVKGIQIYFPLTPTLALAIYCPSHYNKFSDSAKYFEKICKKDLRILKFFGDKYTKTKKIIDVIKTGTVLKPEPENVIFFNSLQIQFAERFIYANSNNFELVEKIIAENDNLKKGIRFRLQ